MMGTYWNNTMTQKNPVPHPSPRWSTRPLGKLLALGSAVLLGACASSPPVRYFTLQGPMEETCAPVLTTTMARSVQLLRLSVPEAVDRPQLVFRTGDNTLNMNDNALWAEPLNTALSRTLAADLSQALGCAPVLLRSTNMEGTAWSLSVELRRFDAGPGRAVVLEAWWILSGRANGKTLNRRSVVRESAAGETPEAIVAAQSRAVKELARDIARQLEESVAAN